MGREMKRRRTPSVRRLVALAGARRLLFAGTDNHQDVEEDVDDVQVEIECGEHVLLRTEQRETGPYSRPPFTSILILKNLLKDIIRRKL